MKGYCLIFSALLFCTNLFADDIKLVGVHRQLVPLPAEKSVSNHARRVIKQSVSKPKEITLLQFELSERAKNTLHGRLQALQNKAAFNHINASTGAQSVQLGMNNVPVLDQGYHGTCVTFANTAAIDALLNRGDYISQLCLLQLSNYLERQGYSHSGWSGSLGPIVLSQLENYGFVSIDKQRSVGCGGELEYPTHDMAPVTDISVTDYQAMSESIQSRKIAWSSLLDTFSVASVQTDTALTLKQVKNSLQEGDRLTAGIFLVDLYQGMVGAVGTHNAQYDTWVLSPEIVQHVLNDWVDYAGHEMIITGYDDHAIAVDQYGHQYRGLLTLRNSWGSDAGDKGNFYISYAYFKAFVNEVQRIRQL